jgi:hypothetical protein
MRFDDIESEFLSSEVGLVFTHELQYSNGATYKGQIKQEYKLDQADA